MHIPPKRYIPGGINVNDSEAARVNSRKSIAIDTTTASGELVFNIFSALAQFERRLIQERTKAGLTAARARGRTGGRKPITADAPRVKTAKRMHQDPDISVKQICATLKISRATFYRYLALPDAPKA